MNLPTAETATVAVRLFSQAKKLRRRRQAKSCGGAVVEYEFGLALRLDARESLSSSQESRMCCKTRRVFHPGSDPTRGRLVGSSQVLSSHTPARQTADQRHRASSWEEKFQTFARQAKEEYACPSPPRGTFGDCTNAHVVVVPCITRSTAYCMALGRSSTHDSVSRCCRASRQLTRIVDSALCRAVAAVHTYFEDSGSERQLWHGLDMVLTCNCVER